MLYQMTIYYGALLNGQAIYSLETFSEDCRKFPSKNDINEDMFRLPIIQAIKRDGLNPDDFEIGYLTKEQYDNRYSKETEKSTTWSIER